MQTVIIVAAAGMLATGLILAGIAAWRDRRRSRTCPGLEAIPWDGVDRLVAIATGELTDANVLRETLDHISSCPDCADRFRVIMILRGAPAQGPVHFTPASLRQMTEHDPRTIH